MKDNHKITKAIDTLFEYSDSFNITDLLIQLRWLHESHIQSWQNGFDEYLEGLIQCGPKKWQNACRIFKERTLNLDSYKFSWTVHSLMGSERELKVFSQDSQFEELFNIQFFKPSITDRKKKGIIKKLTEKPEIRVFRKSGKDDNCLKCCTGINKGSLFYSERNKAYCLKCSGLEDLEFLPSGDATLSRRAKKNSKKFAVVVEFSRPRKRYERRGILVNPEAIQLAQAECNGDSTKRAASRRKAEVKRKEEDRDFTQEFSLKVKDLFPNCPDDEIAKIAAHTTERSSGRVGRTAAAKNLDKDAVTLAVIAHIRHQHTDYDRLLFNRTKKEVARRLIQPVIQRKLQSWRSPESADD